MQHEKTDNKYSIVKRLKAYIRPHYKTFILCFFLLLINTSIKISGPVIIQTAVDKYIITKDAQGLILILSIYICILVAGFISDYIEKIKLETVGQTIVANIKKSAFAHLITLDISYFDQSTTGKLVSRIENDSNEMVILFTSLITTVIGSLLLLFGILGVMAFKYSSFIALVIFSFLPVMAIGGFFFDKFMAPKLIEVRKAVADVSSYVTEIIHGISIIQIFGQETRILNELKRRSLYKLQYDKFTSTSFNSFFNLLFFMQSIAVFVVIYTGAEMVKNQTMTVGSLILFINSLSYFFMPIIELSGQFNNFQKGISGAVRVFELLDTQNTIVEPENYDEIKDKQAGISIEFRNVYFKYNNNGEWVLKDVSFYCPKGEHWAIIGPTGSGKTTIISLILKFYLPQKGSILLNGIDIRNISKEELRNVVGLVLQENILFPGTIYENLTLNQLQSEKEAKSLMKTLGIDSIISKLPNSYNTEIRENGSNLSSGERQLISFGRALMKNPNILIFDEATSNIDPEIENNIKFSMVNLMNGRTSLIIAHRLSTIQNSDKILVLKNGSLIESGSHRELLTLGGFYSTLIRKNEIYS